MDNMMKRGEKKSEEYDPSHPLDSSEDEEEGSGGLNFEKPTTNNNNSGSNSTSTTSPVAARRGGGPSAEPSSSSSSLDVNSIPLPTEDYQYRRPTIQFSIPSRQRLISIGGLLKRPKGVVVKNNKGEVSKGVPPTSFNSEVSKAFQKGEGELGGQFTSSSSEGGGVEGLGGEDLQKVSLVHEIFGSDEEENNKEEEEEEEEYKTNKNTSNEGPVGGDDQNNNNDGTDSNTSLQLPPPPENIFEENKWKTVDNEVDVVVRTGGEEDKTCKVVEIEDCCSPPREPDEEPITISIKPSSELFENPEGDSSSSPPPPDVINTFNNQPDEEMGDKEEEKQGEDYSNYEKENKEIVFDILSDSESDFEVTFVGVGRSNLSDLRQGGSGRRMRGKEPEIAPKPKIIPISPIHVNDGFEEGEIVEANKKKKKKDKESKKKKKGKTRRNRSKESRVSSKRSNSFERKSNSESDSKGVSWKKPKGGKSRNYRNGRRESEERRTGDESSGRRSRSRSKSSTRYSSVKKSRRRGSTSSGRHRSRSRSRSPSRSPFSKRLLSSRNRGKGGGGGGGGRKGGSFRSGSFNSSRSRSRSRSLTRRKRRYHSPTPVRRRRHRSISLSPRRLSKSPTPRKRSRNVGNESSKLERLSERQSPAETHSSRKSSKQDDVGEDEMKKKHKKDKKVVVTEEAEKVARKKKKKREKSISPVKAIMADGDSIVVSLSFQKPKEEPAKSSKSSHSDRSSGETNHESRSNRNAAENCEEIEAPIANHKPIQKKGTILINLDASSPVIEKDHRKSSPDLSRLGDKSNDTSGMSKDEDAATSEEDASSLPQRNEGLDFVSSSHDNSTSNSNSHTLSANEDKSPDRASNNFGIGDVFVSSTCDSKSLTPPPSSDFSPKKAGDNLDGLKGTKASPLESSIRSNLNSTATDNVTDPKGKNPSPERTHLTASSSSMKPSPSLKPMIGNIPGLFPSGFGGTGVSAPSVLIPAPPKIIPNSAPNSLLNLVSVASALYAPLLAGKQAGHNSGTGLSRALQSNSNNIFSKNGHNRTNNGTGGVNDPDSPFSPNSSDGDDLFEPPSGDGNHEAESPSKKAPDDNSHRGSSSNRHGSDGPAMDKRSLFDTLFNSSSHKSGGIGASKQLSTKQRKQGRDQKRSKHKRHGSSAKRQETQKDSDPDLSAHLNEDVPNSAVALRINEKYLKKLNRQERVIEEVKLSLKPHYIKKHISKEEYKDILRRAVPKICHNKSGEINPHKIKELVEAYVKKIRKTRKAETKTA